jgi:hypothetical protein
MPVLRGGEEESRAKNQELRFFGLWYLWTSDFEIPMTNDGVA